MSFGIQTYSASGVARLLANNNIPRQVYGGVFIVNYGQTYDWVLSGYDNTQGWHVVYDSVLTGTNTAYQSTLITEHQGYIRLYGPSSGSTDSRRNFALRVFRVFEVL